jgi:hypothetical protein
MNLKTTFTLVALAFGAASCAEQEFIYSSERLAGHPVELLTTESHYATVAPPLEAERKVSEQDCSQPFETGGGNLLCK